MLIWIIIPILFMLIFIIILFLSMLMLIYYVIAFLLRCLLLPFLYLAMSYMYKRGNKIEWYLRVAFNVSTLGLSFTFIGILVHNLILESENEFGPEHVWLGEAELFASYPQWICFPNTQEFLLIFVINSRRR